jgi:HlyD family secretion protein
MHVPRLFRLLILGVACLGFAAFGWFRWTAAPPTATAQASHGESGSTVVRGTFVRALRLNGLIEAVESVTVQAPRLAGGGQSLVITKLAPKGAHVGKGDLVIEFDRQQQLRNAIDRKADWQDLEEQIKKKRADLVAQDAKDATALKKAESALTLAKLDLLKNDMIPRIEAEKNQLSLEAAEATVKQLRKTLALKRVSAVDDIRILEVRRDRLAIVVRQAEQNAERMSVRSAVDGLVVYRQLWRGGQMGEPQEGLEMWPGNALIDVVGSKAMRVRVKVNQADINQLKTGLLASVRLDAYPANTYQARLDQLSPVAIPSNFSNKLRAFIAVFTIDQADTALTPDLSAAVDVEIDRREHALIAPLDAIAYKDGKPFLRVRQGSGVDLRPVTLGPHNDTHIVIASGAEPGLPINTLVQGAPAASTSASPEGSW